MKKVIFALLVSLFVSFNNVSECAPIEIEKIQAQEYESTFIDTGSTDYEEAVSYLVKNNIISGYPDGTFKPNKTITRAEITTVIAKFNKINVNENTYSKFADINNHWGKNYINTLAELGFVSGYENNDFRPDNEVTCAEVTAMILNSLGYKEEISSMEMGWPNNYIRKAADFNLYENLESLYENLELNMGNHKMTRGEVAILVYNSLGLTIKRNSLVNSLILDYDDIEKFSEGLAVVKKGEKYGYINKDGVEVIPCIYDGAYPFSEGLALVSEITDNNVFSFSEDLYFINCEGEKIISVEYDGVINKFFQEGVAIVNKADKYGVINKSAEEITPCIYSEIGAFSEGMARVIKEDKYGFINSKGKEVIPCIYDRVCDFSEGLACVEKDSKWGAINKNGEEVIPHIYDQVFTFQEGVAIVMKNWQFGVINKDGTYIVPLGDYFIVPPFSEGLAWIMKDNDNWGVINKNGEEVIPCIYDYALGSIFSEGVSSVKIDGKWGVINKEGEEIIPCIYDEVYPFKNGLAIVRVSNKYGLIDKKGKEIVPCVYDYILYDFVNGIAEVEKSYKCGYITKEGKEIIPCIYDDVSYSEGIITAENLNGCYIITLK